MKTRTRRNPFRKLREKRKRIDLIDEKILSLLNQRLRTALEIGKVKKEMGEKIYDPKREKEIFERLERRNNGPLKDEDLKKIFGTIIKACRQSQI